MTTFDIILTDESSDAYPMILASFTYRDDAYRALRLVRAALRECGAREIEPLEVAEHEY